MRRKFVPLFVKPFTWLDTETSGLDEDENEVIEIAIIRVENDGTEKTLHLYIHMDRPENAHPRALDVNGYSLEKWTERGALTQAEAWKQIYESGLMDEAIVAGQNVRFDAGFINASYKRHSIKSRMDYHLYDTCVLALEHLRPWMSSISLVPICVALSIPVRGAHTALVDVRLAMDVAEKLARATDEDRQGWEIFVPVRLSDWNRAGRPDVWPPMDPPA